VQQTVDGLPIDYTLDINAGLTQVLDDGTSTYLYGLERVAQSGVGGDEYFLGDALGSVRQLAQAYEPYGSPAALAAATTP
jgi:hypothetical protein